MPSSKTHYFFAQQRYIEDIKEFPFLKDNLDVVLLSAQGPDPFMFYGNIPFRARPHKELVNNLASRLHQEKDFIIHKFTTFYTYALQKQGKEKDILLSAIYGELTHYALDMNFHPFVFYRTGYVQGIDEKAYFIDHARYETRMDTRFESLYQNRVKSHKIIQCSPHKVTLISKMYSDCIKDFHPDFYLHGYQDMLSIEKVLYDPYGIKKIILSILGLKNHHAHALSHYPSIAKNDKIDYLNEGHTMWKYPDTGIESQLSLLDLQQNATSTFHRIKQVFLSGPMPIIEQELGMKNYDGVAYGSKHLFGESVYKK